MDIIIPNIEEANIDNAIINAIDLNTNLQSNELDDSILNKVHIRRKEPDIMDENNKEYFKVLLIINKLIRFLIAFVKV